MKTIYWLPLGLLALLVSAYVVSCHLDKPRLAPAELSPRQERAVQADIATNLHQAEQATAAATKATIAAEKPYAAGHAAASRATAYRLTTHYRHASVIPTTDSAAARLERQLAAYGN